MLKHLARILLRLLADIGEDAAVDIKYLTINEIGSVRGEEHCRTHEVFGGAPASCRSLGDDE